MPVDLDAIIHQMEWAAKRGLSELTVTLGDTRLHLRRADAGQGVAPQVAPPACAVEDAAHQTVDAPLAGICHLSRDPGSAPFVTVGDDISPGQTVCIIEAMKVMTSVTATVSGRVAAVLVADGASVSAQTPLFEVHP